MSENLEFQQLSKPPITEAVVDFRVKLQDRINVDILKKVEDHLDKKYTSKGPNRKVSATLQVDANDSENPQLLSTNNIVGYSFESSDKHYLIQLNLEGITISRLNGYTSWDELVEELANVYATYKEIVGEFVITRTAVRYINKLTVPLQYLDFDDYLTVAPQVPKGLPQVMSEFVTRTVTPVDEERATVIFMQALQPNFEPVDGISVIIDIDVFSEEQYSSEDAIRSVMLDKLRKLKNKTFFSSITEKALELIK